MTLPKCFISVERHKPAISLSRFAKSSRIQVVLVPNSIIGSCFLKCKCECEANHIFILTIIDIPVQPYMNHIRPSSIRLWTAIHNPYNGYGHYRRPNATGTRHTGTVYSTPYTGDGGQPYCVLLLLCVFFSA